MIMLYCLVSSLMSTIGEDSSGVSRQRWMGGQDVGELGYDRSDADKGMYDHHDGIIIIVTIIIIIINHHHDRHLLLSSSQGWFDITAFAHEVSSCDEFLEIEVETLKHFEELLYKDDAVRQQTV